MEEPTWRVDSELSVVSDGTGADWSEEGVGALGLSSASETGAFSDGFIKMAGVLTADFDLMNLVQVLAERCARLGQAAEVGLLLTGAEGELKVVASSSRRMHKLQLSPERYMDGPCVQVLRSGQAVFNASIAENPGWPRFAADAHAAGYKTVHALPMRHNREVIGVVTIFDDKPVALDDTGTRVAQALADIAAFAIMQVRALHEATSLITQLRRALKSRITIEQAKGILSDRLGIDLTKAFDLLREYSRNTNTRLAEVASNVVERRLGVEEVQVKARAADRRRISRPDRTSTSRTLVPASYQDRSTTGRRTASNGSGPS